MVLADVRLIYLATEDVAGQRVSGKVHFWALARELQALGHQVTVLAPRYGPAATRHSDAIPMIRLFAPGKNAWGLLCFEAVLFAHLFWIRRTFKPELILVRGGGPGWLMGVIFLGFRLLGMPVILECNGLVWREMSYRRKPWWQVAMTHFSAWQQARACSHIIGVSRGITEAYQKLGGKPDTRCVTIPNGTDPAAWEITPDQRAIARSSLGIPRDAWVAGYVGAFSAWHDIRNMVEAAAKLQETPTTAPIWLALVGDGAMFAWACEQQHRRSLQQLFLPGEVADREVLQQWIACFDVGLCLYTDLDGSPLKMFEYMAAGLPIVASGFRQAVELCENEGVGVGLHDVTTDKLAQVLIEMQRDAESWQAVGFRNRQLVRQRYTWGHTARAVEKVFFEAVGEEVGK